MVTLSASSLVLLCLVGIALANVDFYPGRSAPIIVQPHGAVPQDSVAYFKGMNTELKTLEDTRFFDLLAHVMGLPSAHVDADRTGFPSTSLFNKPKASVIIAIDSVGAATLKSFPSLSLFKNTPNAAISSASYPISTATLLANLATGSTPSTHGIVGPSWRRANGDLVLAYDADALPVSANIADIIAQEFDGRSLVVSASASSSFSYAFAVHSDLVTFGWNAHAYALSGDVFASKYEEQEFALFADELAALLKDVKVQVGDDVVTLTVADNMDLIAEIAFVDNLIAKLKTNKLVNDDIPDMYTFVFSGLKGVAQKYGKDSTTFAAALNLVNDAAERLLAALNAAYDSRVASVVLAINPQTGIPDTVQEIVREKVSRLLYSADDFAEQFPAIYVRHSDFAGYAGDLVCSNLQNAIDSDVTVQCFIPRVARAVMAVGNETNNGTTNSTDTSDTVWAFWLNFWITIFIASFILWGAYCLVYVGIDAGKDSLLFRATGRHAHAN